MSLWSTESHTMDSTSNRSDEYIDDALITDSVKKLLSDNSDGNHFDLTADLLTHTTSASHSAVNCEQIGGHSGATVQEGMDLVDALDTLVQHLSRETKALPNDCQPNETNVNPFTPFDLIFMDHNYCKMDQFVTNTDTDPVFPIADPQIDQSFGDSAPQKSVIPNSCQSPIVQSSTFTPFNDNSYASSSTLSATSPAPQTPGSPPVPSTPPSVTANKSPQKTPTASRRSQRQIDRIEKSVLEKIKAENQEMLKREKEEMESPNKIRQPIEPLEDNNKDVDETELVIDLDKKKDNKTNTNQTTNKKRIKRSKSQTNESSHKKSRMDSKHKVLDKNSEKVRDLNQKSDTSGAKKEETSEMDDVIAALRSGVTDSEDNDKTPGSGRQQRNRRKPKRWDDDEVEVDFSGQLGILIDPKKQSEENDENLDQSVDENGNNQKVLEIDKTDKINDKTNDSFDEKKPKENDSQLSSDEDDDETGSDFGSEDDPDKLWCVCRLPHDDRFMIGCDSCEEWFHGSCVNVTKQQGRAMEKAGQEWLCKTCVEGIGNGISRAELKKQADQKRDKLEAEERIRAQTKRAAREKFLRREKSRDGTKIRERRDSEGKHPKSGHKQQSVEQKASVLAKKVSQMPPKKRELHLRQETEEKEKLKKLIQSSKKNLDKKKELLSKKSKKGSSGDQNVQKSPGFEPISKIVPIVRKPEVKKKHKDAIDPSVQDLFKAEPIKKSSVTNPSTPTTPSTPGITPFSRKPSLDSRRLSTSGPTERQCPSGCGKAVRSETTIYCSQECIETHVKECVKYLRIVRKEKLSTGIKLKEFDDRCVVVEKSSGRILSGKDGIPEKDVLEFIKSNPMFEVFKPSHIKDKKKEDLNSKTVTSPIKSPKKEDRRTSMSRSNSRSESESSDLIRANVKSSLKEILVLRCKEVNETSVSSDEIRKRANKIEEELFKLFNKETSNKYKSKYRSLLFNLKDPKNQGLFRKVVNGKISPERLVQMSAEELASSELAKWREREKSMALEMIKRDAAEKVNQVIVKKTHKGEEVIESNAVNESPIDPKIDDLKSTTPTSSNNSGVSTLLDDLMGNSTVDTTALHRTHLFSNNCRICLSKQTDDTKQEVSKKSTTQTLQRSESSRPTPKRVRVDPDSANKILLEAAKLSSSTPKRSTSAEEDESREVPTSTVSLSSPEVPTSSSASRPVWKGTVFMQDVAKFTANAVKVSGSVGDYLSQDISNKVEVIGRIAPEQVLDYVKKLRYSSRTEIGLVKFLSSKEDRNGYDTFFDYLDTRKRYGVVGNTGKSLKDFYILPLPKNGEVPDVLLPFDGPGLDKKSNRPNLLLGILIRSKGHSKVQTPQTSSTNTSSTKSKTSNTVSNTTEFRSYTPPPKTSSNESSPEDSKEAEDVSYTPPRTTSTSWKKSKTKTSADDDEPYDPEEAELSNSNSLPAASTPTPSIEELMEQIAKSTNPVEMTSSVLSAIAGSSNLELQRRLLDQLTAKVDEQKRQLELQKAEAEAQSSQTNKGTVIPGLDGQFASTLKDIKIPDNIHDILSTVKQKTQEIEEQQERLRAVAASGFKFEDPIVKNFGSKAAIDASEAIERSPEAEPMDLDEEVTPQKSTIIEVNTPVPVTTAAEGNSQPKSATDPRLRSKKQTPLSSIAQESGAESQVAAMTADELMQKAREQMAALAQMEANSGPTPNTTSNSSNNNQLVNNNNSNKSSKIKIEWKKRK